MSALVISMSLLLQAIAAGMALRLIRVTGRWSPWTLLAIAMLLMAGRRGVSLYRGVEQGFGSTDPWAEWIALTISVLMVLGVASILPVLRRIQEAEQRARDRAEQLHGVTEALPGLVGRIDGQRRYSLASGRYDEWTGFTATDVVGRTLREVHGAALSAQLEPHVTAALCGESQHFRRVLTDAAGHKRDTQVIMHPDVVNGIVAGTFVFLLDVTDLRSAERKLRHAERVLAQHIENTPLAVLEWSAEHRFVRWSGRAEEIFGWTAAEMLGTAWDEIRFVHEDDAERVSRIATRLVTGDEERNFCENRNYTKDGSVVHCEWNNSVLRDDEGNVISFLSLTKDITDRTRAELRVRESEERLRLALEAARGGAWDWDVRTDDVFRSEEWAIAFGFAHDEVEPTPTFWEERVHPTDLDRFRPILDAVVRGEEEGYQLEYRFRVKSGEYRWVLAAGRIVERDAEGKPTRMLGIDFDISARKQAEKALRLSEERLELATEAAELGVWDWHVVSDTIVLGHRYEQMLGLEPGTIGTRGADWEKFVHSEDLRRAQRGIRDHLAGHTAMIDVEYRMRTGDGGWKWIQDRGRVVDRDDAGEPVRVIGIHIDIDDRKQAELALRLYQQAVESCEDSISAGDRDYVCLFANESFLTDRDRIRESVEGQPIAQISGPDAFQRIVKPNYDRCLGGDSVTFEVERNANDHDTRHHLVSYSPLRDAAQDVVGVVTIERDITELKRNEHRQRLLMRELEHRVKNNIAGLHGLIDRYRDSNVSRSEFAVAIENRLRAMHTVHQLMVDDSELRVDMAKLVERLLAELVGGDGRRIARFSVEGPPIKISTRQSTPLAMIYQELVTNAMKYGALSGDTGTVHLSWRIGAPTAEGQPITIVWTERDGPAVSPPSPGGLGLELISGFAEFELGGRAAFDFDPAGFVCRITGMLDTSDALTSELQVS